VKKGPYKTDYLHIHAIKLFADGALGSRGACLLEPYSDAPDTYGMLVKDPQYYIDKFKLAYKYDYQVNTHTIGDSAARFVLENYGKILKTKNDRRWRIEHAQIIHPDDFKLFGKYNIVPSIQTTHATSDMYWAEDRIGPERMKGAYAFQDLLEENGWLVNGTDFPIENINPIHTFYSAVARKDLKGYPEGGFQMENALTRKQAMQSMTIWAAKGSFEEHDKGSIEKGKMADFVVLDRDIMKVEEDKIPEAKVLATFVAGEMVHEEK
jgi:predicted amidohydrolase YtcJ